MSTLAIVLGIGFLSGVLTFSSGLSTTFNGIIDGSTPRRGRRARRAPARSRRSAPATPRPSPRGRRRAGRAARGGARRRQRRRARPLRARPRDEAGRHRRRARPWPSTTPTAPTWPASRSWSSTTAAGPRPTTRSPSTPRPPRTPATRWATGSPSSRRASTAPGRSPASSSWSAWPASTPAPAPPAAPWSIFSTAGAQAMFLGGADAFTSVALTAADGVDAGAAGRGRRRGAARGYEAVAGDRRRRGVAVGGRGVPRLHRHLPGRLRGDRGDRRRLHHRQHLLDPGRPADPRARAAARPRRQPGRRYAARCCSRPRSPP